MKTVELQVFLKDANIELHSVQRWVQREWILASGSGDTLELTDTDAARALLIHELQGDLGVNDEGIDIVLHLLDQLHGMRRVVRAMQKQIGEATADPATPED